MTEVITSPRFLIILALSILLLLSLVLAVLTVIRDSKRDTANPYIEKERRLLDKLAKARKAHGRIKEIQRQLHEHRFGGKSQ